MENDDRIPDPKETVRLGIEGLHEWHKEQVANGKKLFRLVQSESATDDELKSLVTHRSLLELIFTVIDLQKSLRAIVNQQKSNELRRKRVSLLSVNYINGLMKTYKTMKVGWTSVPKSQPWKSRV